MSANSPNPGNSRRWMGMVALVAGGALAGAITAGMVTANAATTTPTPSASGPSSSSSSGGTTPSIPEHGSTAHESAEKVVTGDNATKAQAAAVKAVGSGTAGEVTTDFTGDGYEVTVTKADGSTVEVHLDSTFAVQDHGGPGGGGDNDNDGPGNNGSADSTATPSA